MRIAVIPARGGSKRIPRKNVATFAGKPMIAHAIAAAKMSGLFNRVIVSTDSEEIALIAVELGAEVPFMRPSSLADDHTPTVPVIAHAITECQGSGSPVELACCIYPCSPLIHVDDLRGALALLEDSGAAYSFPVTEFSSPIQRAMKRSDSGRMQPFFPQFELTRTQDLEPAYWDAGQFYWGTKAAWLSNPFMHSGGVGYVIPNWRVVDIDTPDDWRRAETIFNLLNGQERS